MFANPITSAIQSKGMPAFFQRLLNISRRYGISPSAMRNSLQLLVNLIQEYDCVATFPITAVTLKRNSKTINFLRNSHIEFCIHGYTHKEYCSLKQAEIIDHLSKASCIFSDMGFDTSGFRSPYLSRSANLYAALQEAGFFFTSNQPVLWDVIDPGVLTARQAEDYQHAITYYQPWPMSNCMSLPHLVNDMVEIPVSLPDDEMLFDRLNFSPSQVGTIWREILSQTYTHGELFTLQLHPERAGLCASFLPSLLEHARALSPGIWFAKLSEIADWWKVLNDSRPEIIELSDCEYRFRIQNPGSSTILVRSVESNVPTNPFFNNYQLVKSTDFSIQSPSCPIIGLSPNTSRSLAEFLHQQGLIIEFSADPGKYSHYFDQPSFSQDQERTIMASIDNSTQPLIRLWRWPNGAKSALAITGDIDAMTLMDFILRLIGS